MRSEAFLVALVLAGTLAIGYYSWKAVRWWNWEFSYAGQVEERAQKTERKIEAKFNQRLDNLEKRVILLEKGSTLEKK